MLLILFFADCWNVGINTYSKLMAYSNTIFQVLKYFEHENILGNI